ncbi:hypothetical protein NMG60_11005360 [Bertholletia excelsa]
MEGLIPFVYRAIMQYKNGEQGSAESWLWESPSASYTRLPSDSDYIQTSEVQFFRSDCGFSAASPPTSKAQMGVSSAVQSPGRGLTSRRAVAG